MWHDISIALLVDSQKLGVYPSPIQKAQFGCRVTFFSDTSAVMPELKSYNTIVTIY
jgi:hypothetical protein